MAQFDVHRNPGRHRESIPFVVIVQSTLYEDYRRRVVVPLVSKASLGKVVNPRFNPTFRVEGQSVVLHPLEIVSVARENLGEWVDSLQEDADTVISALDELLTRWR
jgi:toxin CcdB